MRVDLRSKRAVLFGLLLVCLLIFGVGMGAAWHVRKKTICQDGRPPVAQKAAALMPTIYKCHNGQVITESQG